MALPEKLLAQRMGRGRLAAVEIGAPLAVVDLLADAKRLQKRAIGEVGKHGAGQFEPCDQCRVLDKALIVLRPRGRELAQA